MGTKVINIPLTSFTFDLTPSPSSGTLSLLLLSSDPSPELLMLLKSTLIHSISFRPPRDRLLVATFSAKLNKVCVLLKRLWIHLALFYSRNKGDLTTNVNCYVKRFSPVACSQPILFFIAMSQSTQTLNKCKWFVDSLRKLFTTRHRKQNFAAGKNWAGSYISFPKMNITEFNVNANCNCWQI